MSEDCSSASVWYYFAIYLYVFYVIMGVLLCLVGMGVAPMTLEDDLEEEEEAHQTQKNVLYTV